jgi:hypothetical protein
VVVAVELAYLDFVQGPIEDRMPRNCTKHGSVDAAATRPSDQEGRVSDQRLDRTQTFEIGVDIDAADTPEDLEPEDIAPLPRTPKALRHLYPPQLVRRGQVLLVPKTQLPPWMLLEPARLPAAVLRRERLPPQPDLMKDSRNQQSGTSGVAFQTHERVASRALFLWGILIHRLDQIIEPQEVRPASR